MLLILLNYLNGVADPTRDLVVLGCAGWGVVQTQTGMQHEDVLLRHGTVIAQLINSPIGHNNFPFRVCARPWMPAFHKTDPANMSIQNLCCSDLEAHVVWDRQCTNRAHRDTSLGASSSQVRMAVRFFGIRG